MRGAPRLTCTPATAPALTPLLLQSDIKSVLHFAADTDAAELIKILLAHGANADALDDVRARKRD